MTYAAAPLRAPEERAGLLSLWMDVIASRASRPVADWRYQWLFEDNPAGPPVACVTHHVESGEIVACASAHPRPTQVAGAVRAAGLMSDFAVAKDHRIAGAALAVQRRLMTESLARFELIYGSPNKHAEAIFKRLGYPVVGTTVTYTRLLKTASVLQRYVQHPLLSDVAGAFADRVLAATDVRAFVRRPFTFRGEVIARADERFDDLWQRGRAHYGLTGERSAAYLNWRYVDFRPTRHELFALTERRTGRLSGYVVFTREDDVILVDDFFCVEPRRVLDALLLAFASEMRDGKARAIHFDLLADAWHAQALERLLFLKRPGSRTVIARAREGAAPEVTAQVADPQAWFLVRGEIDT